MRILFRCDCGDCPEIGTGHLVRCLLLADRLRSESAAKVAIALRDLGGQPALRDLGGHLVFPIPENIPEPEATLKAMAVFHPDVLVVDRLANEPNHLQGFQREGIVLAVLDDPQGSLEVADLPINAILKGNGGPYEGEDYLVLPEPRPVTAGQRVSTHPVVFLSFGGLDYRNLVAKAVQAVARLKKPVFLSVAVGSHYLNSETLRETLRNQPHPYELLIGLSPQEFSARLRQATVAVVAGGLTMYDAFRHGIPAVVLSQYAHQAAKAKEFADAGIAVYLGDGARVSEEEILSAIEGLLHDAPRRALLTRRGQMRVDGQGLQRVAGLLQVVERLAWDSDFFGFPIGRLWPRRLKPALIDLAERRCTELGIQCLYFLCDQTHAASMALAEARGFQLVDVRVTLERPISALPLLSRERAVTIRPVVPDDLPALIEIAGAAFWHSRFYADPHFSKDVASRFYRVWIEKSCSGFADTVLVAEVGGKASGFITLKLLRPGWGAIELLGVATSHAGWGLGKALVAAGVDWFGARGVERVEVVTQERNNPARRLYQGCGFRTVRVEHWYHRWFEPLS